MKSIVPRNKIVWLLDGFALLVLIAMFVTTIISYGQLPDQIITHYGFDGIADGWGNKTTIFFLPVLALGLYLLLYVCYYLPPKYFDLPIALTTDNQSAVFRLVFHLFALLKLVIMISFFYIQWRIVSQLNLSMWFLPLFVMALFYPIYDFSKKIKQLA